MDKIHAMMIVSFVLGGFAIVAFSLELYANVWGGDFYRPVFSQGRNVDFLPPNATRFDNETNATNETRFDATRFARRQQPPDVLRVVTSPASLMLLVTGIAFIANGLLLSGLTRRRDHVAAKREVYEALLTPDEKLVVKTLSEHDGVMTQKDLALKSGLTAVKTHRVLARLLAKGVVQQHPYGMTNKIMLK